MINLEEYTLNQQRVWRGRISKINGMKVAKKPRFVIRSLSRNDVKAMSKLSATIYAHLNKGEECFIHKHDEDYYNRVFDNKNINYIGVFVSGQLVGMSYVHVIDNQKALNNELPNSPINFFDEKPNMLAASLGADCVHPKYRGNNLNQLMIQYRLNLAYQKGCTDAFSIIDRSNHWNMPPYFSNGFKMFASAIDPSDGGEIALMHHNINGKHQTRNKGICIRYNNFEHIDMLLQHGFVGNSYNQNNKTINFVKTARINVMEKLPAVVFAKVAKKGYYV